MASEAPALLKTASHPATAFLTFVGEMWLIFIDALRRLFARPFEIAETINQMAFIGVASVPIVLLTGFFSGAVLSLYLSQFLGQYGATGFVGATVGLSVTREIGPVLAGIMVSARCGSAMAAQLGSMAVTEQIDALKMLSVHPTNYLVIPRVVACVTMMPILAMVGMWSGVVGGMLVAASENVSTATFMTSVERYVKPYDVMAGLIKAPCFGLIIALVACQQGMRTTQGAMGVGRATTNSVVISMILVYIANFLIAKVLFNQ